MPYPGEVLSGLYQIVDEIGKGGAGIIYRAYHLNLNKYVVVKKIKDNFVGVLNARGEVDILKSLHHTCLPQVYDFLQVGNDIYTVMDYIEGYDLKYYVDNKYVLQEDILWTWLYQLVDVLDYLHKRGILHMDIKPANIMVTKEGNICLIDFNISLAEGVDDITGISEAYASPEQYRKWYGTLYGTEDKYIVLDAATDIYSLGATFFHLMTQVRPSANPANMSSLSQFKLPYSEALVSIINKMLQVDKRKRFQTAEGVVKSIRNLQRTKAEKNTLKAVFGIMLSAILVLLIVGGVVLYRSKTHVRHDVIILIQEKEASLLELCDTGEYQTAYQQAVEFLNVEQENLEKVEGARQGILEILVEACIGTKDYNTAMNYLNELFAMEEKSEYYQKYAIIVANKGEYENAEKALEKAKVLGGDGKELKRSEAEIKVAQGLYAEALEKFKEIYDEEPEGSLLRRMASVSLSAAQKFLFSNDLSEYANYLSQAITYYERLLSSNGSSYSDRMNLAAAYTMNGLNEKAIAIYQDLSVEYPDRYEVFKQLAIFKYNSEMKKSAMERDFKKAKEYAATAERLYKEAKNTRSDEQLEDLLDKLKNMP